MLGGIANGFSNLRIEMESYRKDIENVHFRKIVYRD